MSQPSPSLKHCPIECKTTENWRPKCPNRHKVPSRRTPPQQAFEKPWIKSKVGAVLWYTMRKMSLRADKNCRKKKVC